MNENEVPPAPDAALPPPAAAVDQSTTHAAGSEAKEAAAVEQPGAKTSRWHLRGVRAWFALAAVIAGVLGWQWVETRQRIVDTQQEVAKRLSDGAGQINALRELTWQGKETMQALQSRLVVLEARLADFQSQQAALEGLYQELARGRDEWLLSEVEQLVGLASQQLQLAGNVQAAILALNNADARLARSDRPQFITLRKAIDRDLQRLRSTPLIDLQGLSLKVENVILAVDQMGTAFDARPGAATGKSRSEAKPESKDVKDAKDGKPLWERLGAELWGEIKSLVHVERLDKPDPVLLSPNSAFFLRENLKLRLLNARMALLSHDQATFRGELKQSLQALDRFFDGRDRNVLLAVETLKPMISAEVAIDVPTLSESQSALRNVKLAGERRENAAR
jgi:uroporphyrin-III C-methyltransferase